jgi:hypothetical protein
VGPPRFARDAAELKGRERSTVMHDGRRLDQWQYEFTAGGRIWYFIDDANKTVGLSHVVVAHPKATERR